MSFSLYFLPTFFRLESETDEKIKLNGVANPSNVDGVDRKELEAGGGIEFEGVHIDDDPQASMVVMRRFLFYNADEGPHFRGLPPSLRLDKSAVDGNSLGGVSGDAISNTNLTTATVKSARRVTLFEGEL